MRDEESIFLQCIQSWKVGDVRRDFGELSRAAVRGRLGEADPWSLDIFGEPFCRKEHPSADPLRFLMPY